MNIIITYSLLAYINDDCGGVSDLSDIFTPLVKRVISKMNEKGILKGNIDDIKKETDETYSLDIPYPILHKIIRNISKEENVKVSKNFEYYSDRSFVIKRFLFSNYEEIIQKQEKEIENVNKFFNDYLISQNLKVNEHPTIFEFLYQNSISLSKFFASSSDESFDSKYLPHANFVNSIKENEELFLIVKKIYFGSIITSYLEIDLGDVHHKKVELVFDANFLINTLGLCSFEKQHTCLKILNISNSLGYKLSVIDCLLDETKALLERKANEFNQCSIMRKLDSDNIYSGCERLGLGKSDLQRLSYNLESNIKSNYNITVIPINKSFNEKLEKTDIYDKMMNRKYNIDGARNDAAAIYYVQEKRKKAVTNFNEACCWFVSYSDKDNIPTYYRDGTLWETIWAENLLNILWLSNPNIESKDIVELGLTRIVSGTINKSLPDRKILKQLDANIQKYSSDQITPEDCFNLATLIANKTIINLVSCHACIVA